MSLIHAIHFFAGIILVAEALNKLERTCPFSKKYGGYTRAAEWIKASAWVLLALGGAGAIITPFVAQYPSMQEACQQLGVAVFERPTLQDACVLAGIAALIIRDRVLEIGRTAK